ncbi:hypothetical protein [Thermopirellula anaerolimosa]
MVRLANRMWKRYAVLALAGWWGVSLTFAPLLHRHAAEPSDNSCGPICLGEPIASSSFDPCHDVPADARHTGRGAISASADDGPPRWASAPAGHHALDAAHCLVCHFLTQGQDRAPKGYHVPRAAWIVWTQFPDTVPRVSSPRHSHRSRGPPAFA